MRIRASSVMDTLSFLLGRTTSKCLHTRHCRTIITFISFILIALASCEVKGALNELCLAPSDCSAGRFCAQPPRTRLPGHCEACWQCCLLPSVYDSNACSSCRCGAASSQHCTSNGDCGPGEFCAVLGSRSDLPVCRPCTLCREDWQSWLGDCAAACPSGALQTNGVPEAAAEQYVFAAFALSGEERTQTGLAIGSDGIVQVTEDALRWWLGDVPALLLNALLQPTYLPPPRSLLPPGMVWMPAGGMELAAATAQLAAQMKPESGSLAVMNAFPSPPETLEARARAQLQATYFPDGPRIIPLGSFAIRLASYSPPSDPRCPQPSLPNDTDSTPAAVVFPGCPCNATSSAASFRCPAGYRCSRRAWWSLPGDMITLGSAALLKASCVVCTPGSYCPEGTAVEEANDIKSYLDCPQGWYCPDPSSRLMCPAGSFCPLRSIAPSSCDYTRLLQNSQGTSTSYLMDDNNAIRENLKRLLEEGEPMRGNYCPNASVVPNQRCSAGYYCPNTSHELLCPPGSFCRAESIAPRPCPPLTDCGAPGTAAPSVLRAAMAAFFGVTGVTFLLTMALKALDGSKRHSESDQERRSRGERALRELVAFLYRRPMASSYPELAALRRCSLVMDGLKWKAGGQLNGAPILNGVSGRFEAGHLSAILGPSGCGKSSLLSVLAGRMPRWPASSGLVMLLEEGNWREVHDPAELRGMVGFVPQDDIVCTDLTIRENLEYSAALRLPRRLGGSPLQLTTIPSTRTISSTPSDPAGSYQKLKSNFLPFLSSALSASIPVSTRRSIIHRNPLASPFSSAAAQMLPPTAARASSLRLADRRPRCIPDERRRVVDEVLGMLALRTVQAYRVGTLDARIISGGQRKRLNIGLELVSRPAMLFLDEPTSGLDASCCSVVLRSLSNVASGGVNVVAVVHQPRHSVFSMFDEVQLLGETGRTVYHGPPLRARDYFEGLGYSFPPTENVADTLLDIVTGKIINQQYTTAKLPHVWLKSRESWAVPTPTASKLSCSSSIPPTTTSSLLSPFPTCSTFMLPSPAYMTPRPITTGSALFGASSTPRFMQAGDRSDISAGGRSPSGSAPEEIVSPQGTRIGVVRPEFTEDIKEILEAEFEMVVRMQPRLLHTGSAIRPVSRASSARSATSAVPDGLNADQLLLFFRTLGQEDADARALVKVILARATVQHTNNADESGLPRAAARLGSSRVLVSKAELIEALLEVASGALTVPEFEEEDLDEEEEPGRPSVARQLASMARGTLGVVKSFNAAAIKRMRLAAGSFFHAGGLSPSASFELRSSQPQAVSQTQARPLEVGPSGRIPSMGARRDSASGVPRLFMQLLGNSRKSPQSPGIRAIHFGRASNPSLTRTSAASSLLTRSPRASARFLPDDLRVAEDVFVGGEDCIPLGDVQAGGQGNTKAASSPPSRVPSSAARSMTRGGSGLRLSRLSNASAMVAVEASKAPTFGESTVAPPGNRQAFYLARLLDSSVRKHPKFGHSTSYDSTTSRKVVAGSSLPRDSSSSTSGVEQDAEVGGQNHLANNAEQFGLQATARALVHSPAQRMVYGRLKLLPTMEGSPSVGSAQPPRVGSYMRAAASAMPLEATILEEDECRMASSPAASTQGEISNSRADLRFPYIRWSYGRAGEKPPNESLHTWRKCESVGGHTSRGNGAMGGADALQHQNVVNGDAQNVAPSTDLDDAATETQQPQAQGDVRPGVASPARIWRWPQSVDGEDIETAGGLGRPSTALASRLNSSIEMSQQPCLRMASHQNTIARNASASAETSSTLLDTAAVAASFAYNHGDAAAGSQLSNGQVELGIPESATDPDLSSRRELRGASDNAVTATCTHGSDGPSGSEGAVANGPTAARPRRQMIALTPLTVPDVNLRSSLKRHGRHNGGGYRSAVSKDEESERSSTVPSERSLSSRKQQQETTFKTPGWGLQLWWYARRAIVQSSRAFWPARVLEVALLLAAAAAVGANQGADWGPLAVPSNTIMAMLCLAVLAVVQHLRIFSGNRLIISRERGAGLSPTAYFTARCLVDLPWIFTAPIIFTLPYYILTVPRAAYGSYYIVGVGVWWWASGLSYLVTAMSVVPPAAAPTAAVLITLIMGALLHGGGSPSLADARGNVLQVLLGTSYNRWALEALSIAELDNYIDTHGNVLAVLFRDKGFCSFDVLYDGGLKNIETASGNAVLALVRLSTEFRPGYCRDSWRTALIVLFSIGLGLRLLAMLAFKYDDLILWCAHRVVRWWRGIRGWRADLAATSRATAAELWELLREKIGGSEKSSDMDQGASIVVNRLWMDGNHQGRGGSLSFEMENGQQAAAESADGGGGGDTTPRGSTAEASSSQGRRPAPWDEPVAPPPVPLQASVQSTAKLEGRVPSRRSEEAAMLEGRVPSRRSKEAAMLEGRVPSRRSEEAVMLEGQALFRRIEEAEEAATRYPTLTVGAAAADVGALAEEAAFLCRAVSAAAMEGAACLRMSSLQSAPGAPGDMHFRQRSLFSEPVLENEPRNAPSIA